MNLSDWVLPPNFRFLLRFAQGQTRRSSHMAFFRGMVNWTVPANLQRVILSMAYKLRGVDVSKNIELKNLHAGKRCFVIGNGPSLKGMDLSPLAEEVTIGANSFYKHPSAEAVDLKFLCIGDDAFMVDEPRAVDWHRIIEEKMPRTRLLLHPKANFLREKHGIYQGHEVYNFRRGVVSDHPELIDFDLCQPINVGNTSGSQLAIPLAIYLGCTDIVLVGFDCNWLESYTGSYHFYEKHDQFPEFDALVTDDRWGRYEDHLVFALRDYQAHRLIHERATQLKIRIRNATAGGLLDTYPRARFEEVLEEK